MLCSDSLHPFLLICVAREKVEKIRKKIEPNLETGMLAGLEI